MLKNPKEIIKLLHGCVYKYHVTKHFAAITTRFIFIPSQ